MELIFDEELSDEIEEYLITLRHIKWLLNLSDYQIPHTDLKKQILEEIENDLINIDRKQKMYHNDIDLEKLNALEEIIKLDQIILKDRIAKKLQQMNMPVQEHSGFVYAEGEIPVLLVAHLDTYCDNPPKNLKFIESDGRIYSNEGNIGADDRCGVYAILEILKELKTHVLFTVGEEIGGLGAVMASRELAPPKVKYIIELDRYGKKQCVFYRCGNKEFKDYIESFGYKTKNGSNSDISTLGAAWDIATVNLSIGYHHAHKDDEYINYYELRECISNVKNIIFNSCHTPYFDYQNTFEERLLSKFLDYIDEKLETSLANYWEMSQQNLLGKAEKTKK